VNKIARHLTVDLLKNKAIWGTLLLLAAVAWGLFYIEGSPEKAMLILLQVTLLVIPLITLIFGSAYYYNSHEFIELLLSHPIKRKSVIQGFYLSISTAFSLCYMAGVGIPLLLFYRGVESLFMLTGGLLLIWTFCGLALCISTSISDRVRGMGLTLIIWAFFAFIFDGLLVYIMYQFGQYPIEGLIMALSFLNPIDITRIAVIMQTEAAAMMGLSGAVFVDFFGSAGGVAASFASLLVWVLIMYAITVRIFSGKDL
jgi:Cu-processing system permease protein